jgi:hypothetical protein
MASPAKTQFCTGYIKGELSSKSNTLEVGYKGKSISGSELKDQVRKWVEYGTIEPSAGDAILSCIDNPHYLDLTDRYFVLLGAGSAMGPFEVLTSLGANIIAVDLDRAPIWQRLISRVRKSSGSITFPMTKEQSACNDDEELFASSGCNLFTETPKIRDWLVKLYPDKPFTVGSYAYLNGALHVQVSLAMDAICRDLCDKRKGTSLAYLCTPTDLHLIPKEAHDAAAENYKDFSKRLYCELEECLFWMVDLFWMVYFTHIDILTLARFYRHLFHQGIFVKLLLGKRALRRNDKKPIEGVGGEFYYVNGISVAQGPNYGMSFLTCAS